MWRDGDTRSGTSLTAKGREGQALALIERICDAALDPAAWRGFATELSQAYGGAAVGFALQLPGFALDEVVYGIGLQRGFEQRFADHVDRGLPWDAAWARNFVGRFGFANEVFPDAEVAGTDFYREWMEPQGLAAVGPIGHTVALERGRPTASLSIYRRKGGRRFEPDDLRLGDLLVPHLAHAYRIHTRIRENAALAEAIDRIPTGLILLDARHRAVIANCVARYIVDLRDGFSLDDGRPRATRSSDDAVLQQSIRQATQRGAREEQPEGAVMAITRPSGHRAFPVMVAPLLNAPPESTLLDAVAVLYISDLEGGTLHRSEVLREVYGLTEAETQLVELLCDGCSLEELAARRGVTLNTVRSQLKQVFAKTNTHRQSELVRLVLAAIAPIAHPEREKSKPER